MDYLEKKLDLILRGQHILIRMNAAPTEPKAQLEHYSRLQKDIGPWLTDYVTVQEADLERQKHLARDAAM